jgi:hypothetical protein
MRPMTTTQEWPGQSSTIAERLKWIREHRGYTSPRNAATVLSLQVETYRKHENGERGAHGLKDHHVKRYARAFQVNSTWLQSGKGSPFSATMDELSAEELRVIEALRAARGAA